MSSLWPPRSGARTGNAQAPRSDLHYQHADAATLEALAASAGPDDEQIEAMPVVEQRTVDQERNVGRNDPCWCGSGKKFKRCHGA